MSEGASSIGPEQVKGHQLLLALLLTAESSGAGTRLARVGDMTTALTAGLDATADYHDKPDERSVGGAIH
jgi:hypothetical protein